MSTHGKNLLVYWRVSDVRGREGDSYITEKVQIEACRDHAKHNGHTIIDVLGDRDKGGGTMDRPAFNEVMRRIEAGEADGVIVYRVNRFGRTLSGGLLAMEKLTKAGKTFVSASEGADPTTKTGKLMLGLLLLMAEFERDTIGENWSTAKGSALGRGVYISAVPPFGYDRGADGRLVPNADAKWVREAFERRGVRGQGLQDIATWLSEVSGQRFTRTRVHAMMGNHAYIGETKYKGFESRKGTHDAIVESDVWDAVQAVPIASRARSQRTNLLGGLVRCAGCRYCMRMDSYSNGGTEKTRTYRCKKDHGAGACQGAAVIKGLPLEEYVEREFLAWAQGLRGYGMPKTVDLSAAEADVKFFEDDLRAFSKSPGAALLPDFEETVQEKVAALEAALVRLADLRNRAGLAQIQRDPTLVEKWPELPMDAKRELVAEVVRGVFVRTGRRGTPVEDRVRIVWKWQSVDLPKRTPGTNGGGIVPFPFS